MLFLPGLLRRRVLRSGRGVVHWSFGGNARLEQVRVFRTHDARIYVLLEQLLAERLEAERQAEEQAEEEEQEEEQDYGLGLECDACPFEGEPREQDWGFE